MSARTLGGFFAVAALVGWIMPAAADVTNGGFEDTPDFDGWAPSATGGGTTEVLSSYTTNGTRLAHLKAETTYTWDSGISDWVGTNHEATVQQGFFPPSSPLTTEAGETALRYDALTVVTGEGLADWEMWVDAFVGPPPPLRYCEAPIDADVWTTDTIDLDHPGTSDPLPAGSSINIVFRVINRPPDRDGDGDGEVVTQTAHLYLDNVALVPAPPVALIFLIGGGALLRRRRK